MEQQINTWTGGMDKDTSKLKLSSDKYTNMINGRIITTEGGTTGTIENEPGLKELFTLPDIPSTFILGLQYSIDYPRVKVPKEYITIKGVFTYGTDIIIFTSTSYTGQEGFQIWLLHEEDIQSNQDISISCLKYYSGKLQENYILKCIISHEFGTDEGGVYRLYWTDGNDYLRTINLYDNTKYPTRLLNYTFGNVYDTYPFGGNVPRGIYTYAISFLSSEGESLLTEDSNNISTLWRTIESPTRVSIVLEGIPNGPFGTTAKIIYRKDQNNNFYKVGQINNNTQSVFTDTVETSNIFYQNKKIIDVPIETLNIYDTSSIIYPQISLQILEVEPLTTNIQSNLPVGKYQFAYQYYNSDFELLPSQPTELIYLVSEKLSYNSSNFHGSDEFIGDSNNRTLSNKSVKITIDKHKVFYSYIRIYAFHYYSNLETPSIINYVDITLRDSEISGEENIIYLYTGNNYTNTISYVDFLTKSMNLFKCQTLEVKNNKLLVGNIEYDNEFEVSAEFDCRIFGAVKYPQGGFAEIQLDSNNPLVSAISTEYYNFIKNPSLIPFNHDCIQPFQDYIDIYNTSPGKYTFEKYNNKDVVGREGLNIKCEIIQYDYLLNNNIANSYPDFTLGFSQNSDIKGFYFPTETYAFGVHFFDVIGRKSSVQWMSDIYFPRYDGTMISTNYINSLGTITNSKYYYKGLGIKFTLKNIPKDATHWQIVKCERTEKDKTVLFAGYYEAKDRNAGFLLFPELQYDSEYTLDIYPNDYLLFVGTFRNTEKFTNDLQINTEHQLNFPPAYQQNNNTYTLGVQYVKVLEPGESITYNGVTYTNEYDTGDIANNYLGPCSRRLFVYSTNNVSVDGFNGYAYYKRSIIPYNGNTYNDRINRVYKPSGKIYSVSQTITDFNGDCYVGYLTSIMKFYKGTETPLPANLDVTSSILFMGICESTYNLNLQSVNLRKWYDYQQNRAYLYRLYYSVGLNGLKYWAIQPTLDEGTTLFSQYGLNRDVISDSDSLVINEDTYKYNQVYSKQNTLLSFYTNKKNIQKVGNNLSITNSDSTFKFPYRVLYSNNKVVGNLLDEWRTFYIYDFKDMDADSGEITELRVLSDQLLVFQIQGVAILPVDERGLISAGTSDFFTLGDGKALGRYLYLSKQDGLQDIKAIVNTDNQTLYFFDRKTKRFNALSGGQITPLSVIKGMNSFFNKLDLSSNNIPINNILLGYDSNFNRIKLSFLNNYNENISFNTLLNVFDSFHDSPMNNLFNYKGQLYFTSTFKDPNSVVGNIDYENRKQFYLSFIINKYPNNLKVFTNCEWNSIVKVLSSNEWIEYLEDNKSETFNRISFENDYQKINDKSLVSWENTNISDNQLALRRLMRAWRIKIPRADSPTLEDYARIRDYYIKVNVSYEHNRYLILNDFITSFII